jgi:hypothetical protein
MHPLQVTHIEILEMVGWFSVYYLETVSVEVERSHQFLKNEIFNF